MDLGSLVATLGAKTTGLRGDLLRAERLFGRYRRNVMNDVRRIRRGIFSLRNAFLGLGGAMVVRAFIKFGMEYERSMSIVQVVSAATADEMEALRAKTRELGASTEFTASEAAKALKFLSMAGLEVTESLVALPQMLDLATAGQIDLARAADISTNILSQMGMEVHELTKVNDALVAVQATANTNIEEAAQAFIYAGAKAKTFGVDVFELNALIGMLANNGIKASMAGTTLRQSMIKLIRPTSEGEKILDKYNIQVSKTDGTLRNFTDVLKDMADAQLSAVEITELFGARAGNIELILTEGSTAIQAYIDKLRSMEGVSKDAADTIRSDVKGSFDELVSTIQDRVLMVWDEYKDEIQDSMKASTKAIRDHGSAVITVFESVAAGTEIFLDSIDLIKQGFGAVVGGVAGLQLEGIDEQIKLAETFLAKAEKRIQTEEEMIAKARHQRGTTEKLWWPLAPPEYTSTENEFLEIQIKKTKQAEEQRNFALQSLETLKASRKEILLEVEAGDILISQAKESRKQREEKFKEIQRRLAQLRIPTAPPELSVTAKEGEDLVGAAIKTNKDKAQHLTKEQIAMQTDAIMEIRSLWNDYYLSESDKVKNWYVEKVDFINANVHNEKVAIELIAKLQEVREAQDLEIADAKLAINEEMAQKRINLEKSITKQIMDEHNKLFQSGAEKIWAEFNARKELIDANVENEKLHTDLINKLVDIRIDKLEDWKAKQSQVNEHLLELSERTANAIEESFSTLFFDTMRGELDSLQDYWLSFLQAIQRATSEIMGQMIKELLFGGEGGGKSGLGGLFGGLVGALFGGGAGETAAASETGNLQVSFAKGNIIPFGRGGLVKQPTLFPMANGATGLMGEKGWEVVMPLIRTASGDLGVKTEGDGGDGLKTVNVTIIAADAKSFAEMTKRNPQAIVGPIVDELKGGNVSLRTTIKNTR